MKLFYKDRSRVQITKFHNLVWWKYQDKVVNLWDFYTKCECCNGNGFKKTSSIVIYNIITIIKGIDAINNKNDIELVLDDDFYDKNLKEIKRKIKLINLSFKVNITKKSIPKNIYEFNQELLNEVNNNTKELIDKNKTNDITKDEKSYRRKIKRKSIEKQN